MELVALCVTLFVAVAMFAARIVLAKKQQKPTAIANSPPVAPQSSPASTTAGEPQIASVAVAAPRAERDASTAAVVAPPPVAPEQQEEPPLSSSPQGGKPSQQTDQEETVGAAAATTPSGKVRKVKRVLKPRAKRDTEETSAAEMSDARRPAPAPRVTSRSRAAVEDTAPPPPQPPKPTAAPPLPPRVPVTPPPGVARPSTPTAAAPNGQAATHPHHQSRVSPQLRRTVSPYGITGMAVGRTTSPGGRIQPSASGNHSSNEGGASASRPAPSSRPSSSPFRKVVAEGPSPAPAAPYTPPAVRNYQSDAAAVPSRRQYHSDAMPASRSAGRRAAEDSDYMSAPVLAMPVSRPKVKKATIAVAEARHKQHVAELTSLHEQFLRDAEAAKRDIQREREETARKAADLEADRQMFHARGSSPSTTAPASSTRVRVPPLEIGSVSPVTTNGGLESRRTEVPFQSNHGGSSAGGPLGYFSSQEGEQSDLSSRRVAAAPLQQGGAGAATPTLGKPRERTNSTYMMMDRIQQQPQDEMNNMAPPAVEKTLPRPEPKALVESVLQSPKKSSRSARHNAPSPVVVAVGRERNDSHHHAIEVGVTAGTVRTPPRAHPEQASPRQTHNNNKEEPQPKEAKEAKKSSREKMPHRREASEESNSGPVAVPTVGLRKERSDHRLHTPPPPLPPAATTAAAADSEEQTPLEATAPPPSMSKRPRDDEPVASTTTTAASPYRETYSCTVVFTGGPRPFYEKVRDVSTMERRQEHDEIMQGLHAAMLFDCSLSMNIPRDQLTLSPPIVITAPSKSQPSSAVNRSVKTVDEMIEEHDETLKAILEGKDPRYGDEEDANAVGGEEERSRLVTSVLHVKFDPTSVSSAELEERLRQGGLLFRATDRNPDPLSLLQAQNTGHYQPEEDGASVFPVPAGHISATRQYMETLIASSIALSSPRPPLSPPRARAAAAAALQQQDNQGAPSNVETIDRTSPRTSSSSSSSSATSSRSSTPTPNRNASSSVVVVPLQPTDLTFQSSCDQSNIRSPPAAADSPSKPLITKRRVSLRPPNALALEFGENGCERNDEDYRKRQRDAVTLRQILVLTACEESSSRAAIEVEEVGELALITNDEQNARRALQPVEQEEVPKATSPMSSTTRRKLALVQGMLLQNEDDLRNEIEDLEEDQRRALEESEETQRERYHRRRQAACIRQEERERDDLLREEMKVRTEELQTLNDDLYELLAAEEAAAIEAAEREAAEKAAQEAAERAAREAAERAAQEAATLAAKEAEEQAAKEAAERAAKEAADRAAREAAEREALEEEEREAREAHDADEASALRDAVDTEAAEREAAVAATLAREAAELAAAAAAAAEEEELPSSVSNDSSVSIAVADEQPDVEEEAAPQVLETDLQFLQEVQAGEEEGWDAPGSEKSPQRQLAAAASRPPKPFHYATFEASDMDHYPTAVLALRGMLRCSVRRGLDVSNVQAATTSLAASVRMFHFGDLCGLTEEKIKTPVPSEQAAAQDSEKQAGADDKGKKNKKKEKKQRKVEATTVDPQPQEGPSEADAQPTQAEKKKKKKGFFKSLVDKVDDMISSSSSSSSSSDDEEDRSSSSSSTSASSKSVKSDTAPQKSSSAKTKKTGEGKEAKKTNNSSSSSNSSASSSSRSSSRSSSTSSTLSSSLSSPSSISTTTKETAKKEEEEAELPSFARSSNNCARFLTERSLFEDGDTLIEFNGHALHSHGHLRDLLAERAVAIRTAMLQEIEPDVNKWIGVGPDVLGGSVCGPGRGITSTPPPPPEFENDAQREEWEAARNQRELEAAAEARRRLGMSAKLARLIAERFVAEVTVIRGGSDIEIVMLDS